MQPSAVPIPAVNAEPPGQAMEPSSRLTGIQPSLDPAGSPEPPPDVERNGFQVVLLIHGIRTEADWGPMVRSKLEVPGQIEVIPIRYGYFDAFRFWFPFWTRNKPVERVYEQIRVALQKYRRSHPDAKLSIIAHSFGTYIIGEILKRGFDLQIDRLLLCGSVLPQDFPWHQYQGRFDDDKVVNECGKSDIWPVLAQSASWGYGASGTHGFGAVLVKDRFHAGGHGQYFDPGFVEKYWKPFIRRGEYKGTEFETKMPTTPWWLSVLGILPLQWTFAVLLSLVAGTALYQAIPAKVIHTNPSTDKSRSTPDTTVPEGRKAVRPNELPLIVARPAPKDAADRNSVILQIQGVHVPVDRAVFVLVFLGLPDATATTSIDSDRFAGFFVNIDESHKRVEYFDVNLPVGDRIRRIFSEGSQAQVTLVPVNSLEEGKRLGTKITFDRLELKMNK